MSDWVQVGSDLVGRAPSDLFGWMVSLSHDGKRMAVTSAISGQNPPPGLVQVFKFEEAESSWVQIGSNIWGNAATTGIIRREVAIAGNGNSFIVHTNPYPRSRACIYDWDEDQMEWIKRQDADSIEDLGVDIQDDISVTISEDGLRAAVGIATPCSAGSIRFVKWDWKEKDDEGHEKVRVLAGSYDLLGDASGLGTMVAMSDDGKRVASLSAGDSLCHDVSVHVFREEEKNTTSSSSTSYSWNIMGKKIQPNCRFTSGLAISGNGNCIAFGCFDEIWYLSNGTRIQVPAQVLVYDWNEKTQDWEQSKTGIAKDIYLAGCSIALSYDGSILAVSRLNVRIYHRTGGDWEQVSPDIPANFKLDWKGKPISLAFNATTNSARIALSNSVHSTVPCCGNRAPGRLIGQVQVFDMNIAAKEEIPTASDNPLLMFILIVAVVAIVVSWRMIVRSGRRLVGNPPVDKNLVYEMVTQSEPGSASGDIATNLS